MNIASLAVLGVFCLGIFAVPAVPAGHDDLKVFQKAVKKNPAYVPGREAQCLKIVIADRRHRGERVSLRLPLALVELILGCADSRHFRLDGGDCEIDLRALFKDLKKAGPGVMIELRGDDGLIKIWLE